MRGRIRQLKPELFLDDDFWSATLRYPDLPLLQGFLGLWCQADREGRFEWRPAVLKTQILPYWAGDFALILEALVTSGFLHAYEIGGRCYGFIRTFARHQRPNSREPVSSIPAPVFSPDDIPPERVRAEAPRATQPPLPTPDTQLPIQTPTRATEVPGLRIVHPGPLQPSKREQELDAKAEALNSSDQPRHEFTPGWIPGQGSRARGHELGLTDEEIWARWETCKDKHFPSAFRSDVKQFNRELAFAAQDKTTVRFRSAKEREAFEMPGRERRVT